MDNEQSEDETIIRADKAVRAYGYFEAVRTELKPSWRVYWLSPAGERVEIQSFYEQDEAGDCADIGNLGFLMGANAVSLQDRPDLAELIRKYMAAIRGVRRG